MIVVLLVVAAAAMAAQDVLGTLLVVAEARGRAKLAGAMDALGDVARVVCTLVGVDSALHGVGVRTVLVLGTMAATSYFTTSVTTDWARRLKPAEPRAGE